MTPENDKVGKYLFGGIVGLVSIAAILGFLALPTIQGSAAGLDPWSAICRAIGIQAGSPAEETPPADNPARPVSVVVWDKTVVNELRGADKSAGAELAKEICAACHGETGTSPDSQFPHLSGQSAFAIYKQLHDYKNGVRQHELMSPVAETLTEEQIVVLANHYATLARGTLDRRLEVGADPRIDRLIRTGDAARGIPSCQSCHGIGAGGPIETPTISGQFWQYLSIQLTAFATKERRNDVYARMRDVAIRLTDEEIQLLSRFYAEQ